MDRRSVAVFVTLLCAIPLSAAAAPDTVPLETIDGGGVAILLTIDGAGPFRFALDTGSAATLVSDDVARRLAAVPVARSEVLTASGAEPGPVVRLRRVAVGTREASDLLASVVPASRLLQRPTAVDGILGQDFLSRFDYTLDFDRRLLTWDAGARLAGGVRLPVERSGGRLLVALPQGGGTRLRLVLDSGVAELVVFERPGGPVLPIRVGARRAVLETVAGPATVRRGSLVALRFGPRSLWNLPVSIVGRAAWREEYGDGLLPLRLFASVSLHARDGFVEVRPR